MEYIILFVVIGVQLFICVYSCSIIWRIRTFFPADAKAYTLKSEQPIKLQNGESKQNGYILSTIYEKKDFHQLLKDINEYLQSHYRLSRTPPLHILEQMATNHARKYDGKASLWASFPILIGLAGTIGGFIYAFNHVSSTSGFWEAIPACAKIVFYGSLGGILATIFLNGLIADARLKRNEKLNRFLYFVHRELSLKMPSFTDETIKIVSGQLQLFSQGFFNQFQEYGQQFEKMAKAIDHIHNAGIKDIIERNSGIMARLTDNIDKLDSLNETTRSIHFDPQLFTTFMENASALTQSNCEVLQNMKTMGLLFEKVNDSFSYLYNQVEAGVVSLGQDRDVVSNLHTAMDNFIKTTTERTQEMSNFAESFKKDITAIYGQYRNSLIEIRDALLKNIEDNLNPDDYTNILQQLVRLSEIFEKEGSNVQQLAGSLCTLIPALTALDMQVNKLSVSIERAIPAACETALTTNRQMTVDIIKANLRKPKTWGEWSFQAVRFLFRRNK